MGDQNTRYFHKSVNGRHNRNKLLSLTREDGEVVEGHKAVKSEVIVYFHRVLGVDQMPRVLNKEVVESTINFAGMSRTPNLVLNQIECIIRDKLDLMRNVVPTNENKRIQRAWRVNTIYS